MKRKIGVVLFIAVIVFVSIGIIVIENNKKTPKDRYLEKNTLTANTVSETSDVRRTESEPLETTDTIKCNNVILNSRHTVEYQLLAYDLIDDADIAKESFYFEESFVTGHIPDPNYLVESTDYSSMRNDYPEVDEYISSNGMKGMTAADYQHFLNEHLAEYTTSIHPKTKYLFLKCKMTNMGKGAVKEYINDLRVVAVRDGNIVGTGEFSCYFDSSQHTEGEDRSHNFFLYTFQEEGETLDCIIGCELREGYVDISEENTYYVGFLPILDSLEQLDPMIDDGFVSLSILPKGVS